MSSLGGVSTSAGDLKKKSSNQREVCVLVAQPQVMGDVLPPGWVGSDMAALPSPAANMGKILIKGKSMATVEAASSEVGPSAADGDGAGDGDVVDDDDDPDAVEGDVWDSDDDPEEAAAVEAALAAALQEEEGGGKGKKKKKKKKASKIGPELTRLTHHRV